MTTPSFRLTALIESGELADLFQATSAERGEVVIKLFHERTSDAHYARALVEHSGLLNTTVIPGVVHWVDVGFVQRRLAVVREHVEGPLLGAALQRLHTRELLLPTPLALQLVLELLHIVQQVHDAGAVHGAITPGNVLLAKANGSPALFDFGALQSLMSVPRLKQTFVARGRSAYRAPEVAHGEAPSLQSDLYSVGAIAYELLTLHEPRIADGLSTRRESFPPPSRLDRRLNTRIDPILLRALDPSPQRRFKSCADFAGALRNFLISSGSVAGPQELKAFVEELAPRVSKPSGPVPFSDFFGLDGIDDLALPEVQDALPTLDSTRPPFAGGAAPEPAEETRLVPPAELATMDTVEAPPAFAEFRGSRGPPSEGEGTDPGGAGPLERGWDAPASEEPVAQSRKRSAMPLEVTVIRQVGKGPRVKLVEDFQSQAPDTARELPKPAPPPAAPPRPSRAPARSVSPPAPIKTPLNVIPPGASVASGTDTNTPRYSTREREVRSIFKRQRRGRKVALALSAVGLICFAGALGVVMVKDEEVPQTPAPVTVPEVGENPVRSTDPKVKALSRAIARLDLESARDEQTPVDAPPPLSKAGFLSIDSDVEAAVYIDGFRVEKLTPIERYPVWPGERRIELKDPATGERKLLRVTIRKGKTQSFDERFGDSSR